MSQQPVRVVRFNFRYHPSMAKRFALEPDIELQTLPLEGDDDAAWSALADASVYQISSAKDELPPRWFATAELLKQFPDDPRTKRLADSV